MDYTVLDFIPEPVLVVDENYMVVFLNRKAKEVYGDIKQTCYGITHASEVPCYELSSHPCPVKAIKESGVDSSRVIHVHSTKEGKGYFYVIASCSREAGVYVEMHIDISNLIISIGESGFRLEQLLQTGNIVLFLWENKPGWPVKMVTPNVENVFGYTAEEFLSGKVSYADIIHKDDLKRVAEEVKRYTESKAQAWTHEDYRIVRKDGRIVWLFDHTIPIYNGEENITHYYGYILDITEKHEKEEMFKNLSEASPVGIFLRSGKRFVYANKALASITGYSMDELLSLEDITLLVHYKYRHKVESVMKKRDTGIKGIDSYEVMIKRKDGKNRWVRISSETTYWKGSFAGIGVMMDITESKIYERKLKKLSFYDSLTGAYNRYSVELLLEREVEKAKRYGTDLGIVFFDIDNFKSINDTYGHLEGDRVLKSVARIAKKNIRKSDYLGRWGGDEFLIVLPTTKEPQKVAEKIIKVIGNTKFKKGYKVGISAGCAVYRVGESITSFIHRVDEALYRAKSAKRLDQIV
ncbi:MAG: diguanylate cyclase domain-containing protein [Aquificaceae bacterium]